jgi:transposase-like protein
VSDPLEEATRAFSWLTVRIAQRNGSRSRTLTRTAGDLELRIPKLRTGSFFPSLLERRRRVDQRCSR